MSTQIFVNLPVADLAKSTSFYEGLGWKVNPQFTDETAACVVINEHIYVMLLTYSKFKEFTNRSISDATRTTEVINALSANSKDEVHAFMEKALAHGGIEFRDAQDYGFMFSRSLNDPDGHIWEIFWFDPNALQA